MGADSFSSIKFWKLIFSVKFWKLILSVKFWKLIFWKNIESSSSGSGKILEAEVLAEKIMPNRAQSPVFNRARPTNPMKWPLSANQDRSSPAGRGELITAANPRHKGDDRGRQLPPIMYGCGPDLLIRACSCRRGTFAMTGT